MAAAVDTSKPPPGYLPSGQRLSYPQQQVRNNLNEETKWLKRCLLQPRAQDADGHLRVGNMVQIVPDQKTKSSPAVSRRDPRGSSLDPRVQQQQLQSSSSDLQKRQLQQQPTAAADTSVIQKMEELAKRSEAERKLRRERKMAERMSRTTSQVGSLKFST